MNSIGDKIKEYIKKNHMSESDFAKSPDTVKSI